MTCKILIKDNSPGGYGLSFICVKASKKSSMLCKLQVGCMAHHDLVTLHTTVEQLRFGRTWAWRQLTRYSIRWLFQADPGNLFRVQGDERSDNIVEQAIWPVIIKWVSELHSKAKPKGGGMDNRTDMILRHGSWKCNSTWLFVAPIHPTITRCLCWVYSNTQAWATTVKESKKKHM